MPYLIRACLSTRNLVPATSAGHGNYWNGVMCQRNRNVFHDLANLEPSSRPSHGAKPNCEFCPMATSSHLLTGATMCHEESCWVFVTMTSWAIPIGPREMKKINRDTSTCQECVF